MRRLPYISEPVEEALFSGIFGNLQRYRTDGFSDLATRSDWNIECQFEYDPAPLAGLSNKASEFDNALLVWQSLYQLSPSLACEGRIWTRLSHVECFTYSKERWLSVDSTDDKFSSDVKTHFFARTMTARRDDHAIARLWWTAKIASKLSSSGDITEPLKYLTKKADIRSGFVERTMMMSRPVVGRAVIQLMDENPEIYKTEDKFRNFMKLLNRTGGGIGFELQNFDDTLKSFKDCAERSLKSD